MNIISWDNGDMFNFVGVRGWFAGGWGGDFFLGGGAVAPEGLGGGGLHCSTFFWGRGRAH